jgi:hypothetical protein
VLLLLLFAGHCAGGALADDYTGHNLFNLQHLQQSGSGICNNMDPQEPGSATKVGFLMRVRVHAV